MRWLIVAASLTYGLTVGNVTTLPSIIVRREFGAVSFGAVYRLDYYDAATLALRSPLYAPLDGQKPDQPCCRRG